MMKRLDSLDFNEGRALRGRKVLDSSGKSVGFFEGIWIDPSTYRIEFFGVAKHPGVDRVQVAPSRKVQVNEDAIRVPYSNEVIEEGPSYSPIGEFAEVDKQVITRHYHCFTPLERQTDIEEIRPEEATPPVEATRDNTTGEQVTHEDMVRKEQAFFNQKGFVTDSMESVDVSENLEESQNFETRRAVEKEESKLYNQ